jgi:general secretion pathway protein L
MANPLSSALRNVRPPQALLHRFFQRGPIGDFFTWWKSELLGCLPKKWRERLSAPPAQLVFALLPTAGGEPPRVRAARMRGSEAEVTTELELSDPAALRRGLARIEIVQDESAERRVLALGAHQVLRKRLQLPLPAEENLAQVLSFEMDRQTPFKANEVHYDYRVVKRDTAARTLLVDLAVLPKAQLEQSLAPFTQTELRFDAIDVSATRSEVQFSELAGFNLLPEAQRHRGSDSGGALRWILALALLALIGLAMVQSLQARRAALAHLQQRTELQQQKALETARLAAQVREAIDSANFLVERKLKQPETLKIMRELTDIVPNDTWLERVTFVGKSVQLQGLAPSADRMLLLLENSQYLTKAQFQGVIQPDPSSKLERFTVQADLREEPETTPTDTPENSAQMPVDAAQIAKNGTR